MDHIRSIESLGSDDEFFGFIGLGNRFKLDLHFRMGFFIIRRYFFEAFQPHIFRHVPILKTDHRFSGNTNGRDQNHT